MYKEYADIMVHNRQRYVVEHKVLVLSAWYLNEAVSDRNLGPACQKNSQLDLLQRSNFGQKVQDDLDVVVAITLIKRINYNNV
jgi:hypothetical protein